ncbi:hypothetical protein [Variovorax soli]|uniref:Uncharacterized protein n=1 Tax=Variovorax soli TaxID=376815 RepID=A0ABU1NLZ8_9BURK|nr:hypothetical protein [Variovorax soli]MDR6539489.1 hypothetical protein [Variovorax soli]
MTEADWAHDLLDLLAARRDEHNLIRPISSSAVLQILGKDRRAGMALSNARALLDWACARRGLPLLGQLVMLENGEQPHAWGPWLEHSGLLSAAPCLAIWFDAHLHNIREAIDSAHAGQTRLWLEHFEAPDSLAQAVRDAEKAVSTYAHLFRNEFPHGEEPRTPAPSAKDI